MKLTIKQNALLTFVQQRHGAQKRKYTHKPYWTHGLAVATLAHQYAVPHGAEIGLCHDLLEDTECTVSDLLKSLSICGYDHDASCAIVSGVSDLTDVYTKENYPGINRKERKQLEAERLGKIDPISQSVKYCDLIDNTRSIVDHDRGFAKVYLSEKKDILSQMRLGDPTLLDRCEQVLFDALQKIENKDGVQSV